MPDHPSHGQYSGPSSDESLPPPRYYTGIDFSILKSDNNLTVLSIVLINPRTDWQICLPLIRK